MSLFRRRRDERADDESTDDLADDGVPADQLSADEASVDDEASATGDEADERAVAEAGGRDEAVGDAVDGDDEGPYDADEPPDDGLERLDLGALKIPALPGVEVQIQANEQGEVAAVALIAGDSAAQVGAFAAPRSEGIWPEVRAELITSMNSEGGTVAEADGDFGPELRGRVGTPDGPQDVRFVGIDGPRWFLRVVFHGRSATDPSAAPELSRTLRNVIVERGHEAMPVREPLPLTLPAEAVQQAASGEAPASNGPNGRHAEGGR